MSRSSRRPHGPSVVVIMTGGNSTGMDLVAGVCSLTSHFHTLHTLEKGVAKLCVCAT